MYKLITALENALSKGIPKVRNTEIKKILQDTSYSQFIGYEEWNTSLPYTRNLIYSTDKYSLLLLCWNKNSSSVIHNHNSSECFFKCLRGTLLEEQYCWNDEFLKSSAYEQGDIGYINDSIAKHKMYTKDGAVSLHFYFPPLTEGIISKL